MGGDLPSIYWESYEPFTYLAQVAAVTSRLKVATGVCLVPEHHPITLAKRAASLDSLSGGRFLFGVGAGWNAEELENHGIAYAQRWAVLREHILAMRACWTQKAGEYHGEFVDFDPVWVEPKPVSRPHPPIYIGAQSKWALPRIVEYGNGWLPIGTPDLPDRIRELKDLCDAAGRDVSEIDISVLAVPDSPQALKQLADMGAQRVVLSLPTLPRDESMAVLDSYARIVEWAGAL